MQEIYETQIKIKKWLTLEKYWKYQVYNLKNRKTK